MGFLTYSMIMGSPTYSMESYYILEKNGIIVYLGQNWSEVPKIIPRHQSDHEKEEKYSLSYISIDRNKKSVEVAHGENYRRIIIDGPLVSDNPTHLKIPISKLEDLLRGVNFLGLII